MTNPAARVPRVPRTCVWDITTACNLRCLHCELEAGERDAGELSLPRMLELAGELARAGCENVSLTGGEPLLRRDWPGLARRLADLGIKVKIVTNGILVDQATADRMAEAGVMGASVSLDGLREAHDALRVPAAPMGSRFDAALRAIETLVRSPLRTAVITQIHRRNIDDLDSMYDLLATLGVDAWQVQLAFPLGRLLRSAMDLLIDPSRLPWLHDKLAAFVRDGRVPLVVADNIGYYARQEPVLRRGTGGMSSFWMGCMAGCLAVSICSNGDVKGCPSHPRSFVVGNVLAEPFSAIWADESRFAYNTRWQEELLEGKCAACSFRRICRAGCTTMAWAVTGTIYDNPFCVQRAAP